MLRPCHVLRMSNPRSATRQKANTTQSDGTPRSSCERSPNAATPARSATLNAAKTAKSKAVVTQKRMLRVRTTTAATSIPNTQMPIKGGQIEIFILSLLCNLLPGVLCEIAKAWRERSQSQRHSVPHVGGPKLRYRRLSSVISTCHSFRFTSVQHRDHRIPCHWPRFRAHGTSRMPRRARSMPSFSRQRLAAKAARTHGPD